MDNTLETYDKARDSVRMLHSNCKRINIRSDARSLESRYWQISRMISLGRPSKGDGVAMVCLMGALRRKEVQEVTKV